ncbi:MAG: TonB-dependent receptor [Cyanobacteria bacterium P01_G01_bin.54]
MDNWQHARSIGFAIRVILPSSFLMTAIALPPSLPAAAQGHSPSSQRSPQQYAQAETSISEITNVRLTATETGLEVILEGLEDTVTPTPTLDGNALTLEIANAVLVLPEGDAFRRFAPSEDIALIAGTTSTNNRVQLTITGSAAPPIVEVTPTPQGLVVSVEPRSEIADADSTEEDSLRVIVTAEKTPEEAQDVPISLRVLTEQEIEDANITSFEDIAANTPNFSTFSSGSNRGFLTYSIRGISNAGVLNRDTAAIYVDGIPYENGNFINIDLPDLEQIEILRGPQGTLYGRSAISGVVNVTTRKPTNAFEFDSAVSYGNYEDFQIQAGVGGPIIEDKLFFRVSGNYGARGGYIENILLNEDLDEQAGGTARMQLLWTSPEELEVLFVGSVGDYQDGGGTFVRIGDDPYNVSRNIPGFTNLSTNSQALRLTYNHADYRLTAITARRQAQSEEALDADFSSADEFTLLNNADSHIFSQEIRLQSPESAKRFQWLIGGYVEASSFDNNSNIVFGPDQTSVTELIAGLAGVPSSFVTDVTGNQLTQSETKNQALAVFGQVDYQPTDALTLTVGLRYETNDSKLERLEQTLNVDFSVFGLPQNVTIPSTINTVDNESEAFLPRFVAAYRFSPEVMAYGSLTAGYRPAGVNFQAADEANVPYDAERSWNYEVGVKSSWLDDRLNVNFAFFHSDISDFQVNFFDPSTSTSSIGNGGANITGAELEIQATPTAGLDIIAGLGIVEGNLTNLTNPFTGVVSNADELLAAPDLTYNLALQYHDPSGFFGRVELSGFGTTIFEETNVIQQDPFALVNARLGYEFENYGIYFFANNLFDTRYITNGTVSDGGNLASYGVPATYGVQLRARF